MFLQAADGYMLGYQSCTGRNATTKYVLLHVGGASAARLLLLQALILFDCLTDTECAEHKEQHSDQGCEPCQHC